MIQLSFRIRTLYGVTLLSIITQTHTLYCSDNNKTLSILIWFSNFQVLIKHEERDTLYGCIELCTLVFFFFVIVISCTSLVVVWKWNKISPWLHDVIRYYFDYKSNAIHYLFKFSNILVDIFVMTKLSTRQVNMSSLSLMAVPSYMCHCVILFHVI